MSLFEDDGFLEEAPALAVSSSSTPSVQRVITEKAVFTEWCIERNYVFDTTSRLRRINSNSLHKISLFISRFKDTSLYSEQCSRNQGKRC